MTGSYYLDILLICIAGPILLSFDKRVYFIQHWRAVLVSMAMVVLILGLSDIWFFYRGYWIVNPSSVFNQRLLYMPVEEWMFFVLIPYAVLFSYQVVNVYFPSVWFSHKGSRNFSFVMAGMLTLLAFVFYAYSYTRISLFTGAGFLLLVAWQMPGFLPRFYRLVLCMTPLFVITNGFLTGSFGLPYIYRYDPQVILGFYVMKIPVEDFVYNFDLLLVTIGSYEWGLQKFGEKG